MKVAVATQQGGLSDQVSPMVGRAPTFTLVEVEDRKIKNSSVLQNQFAQSASGAGIQAAQMLVNQGIEAIIGGNFGPNLANVFSQAGVKMYQVQGESVENAVNKLAKGELSPAPSATAPGHAGMGMGRGMGGGRGMGMRQSMPQGGMTPPTQPQQGPSTGPQAQAPNSGASQMSKEQELQMLNRQAQALEQQLNQIKKRVEELNK